MKESQIILRAHTKDSQIFLMLKPTVWEDTQTRTQRETAKVTKRKGKTPLASQTIMQGTFSFPSGVSRRVVQALDLQGILAPLLPLTVTSGSDIPGVTKLPQLEKSHMIPAPTP